MPDAECHSNQAPPDKSPVFKDIPAAADRSVRQHRPHPMLCTAPGIFRKSTAIFSTKINKYPYMASNIPLLCSFFFHTPSPR